MQIIILGIDSRIQDMRINSNTNVGAPILRLTVPRLRSWAEHRRGPIWLSGASECERNEAR